MKKRYLSLPLSVLMLALTPSLAFGGVQAITPGAAAALVAKGEAVLVDIRERSEIQSGMAEPAQWLANTEILAGSPRYEEYLENLSEDQKVIVYCATGRRAAPFVSRLRSKGFAAENMGGFDGWRNAGLPVRAP